MHTACADSYVQGDRASKRFGNVSSAYYSIQRCHVYLQTEGKLTELEAAKVMRDILAVIRSCHNKGICYADVKPANFLLKNIYPDARCLVESRRQTDRSLEVLHAFLSNSQYTCWMWLMYGLSAVVLF